jgi:hypothetical protein
VADPLPGVLGDIRPYVEDWGYLGVGAVLLLEDFGLPLPGETLSGAAVGSSSLLACYIGWRLLRRRRAAKLP